MILVVISDQHRRKSWIIGQSNYMIGGEMRKPN